MTLTIDLPTDKDIEELLSTGETMCFATVLDHATVLCPRIGRPLAKDVKFEWRKAIHKGVAERWRLEIPTMDYAVVHLNPLHQYVHRGDTVILRVDFRGI